MDYYYREQLGEHIGNTKIQKSYTHPYPSPPPPPPPQKGLNNI